MKHRLLTVTTTISLVLLSMVSFFAVAGASTNADASTDSTPSQTDAKEAEAQKLKAALSRLNDHRRQQAELNLSFDPETGILTIALKNAGKVPIKVDRELVLLTEILVFDQAGEQIRLKPIDGPVSRPADFGDRFATIQPGETIRRSVSLREGFTSFRSTRVLHKGGFWQASGFESRAKVPPDAAPVRIRVTYQCDADTRDSFRVYTGFDMQALGLFDGPLAKELQIATRDDHAAPTSAPVSQ